MLAAPSTLNPQTGAIVWHGSPHKFDKFDSSKIGTGEGAQAYGHGLYLAESDDVAKMYRDKLTDPAFKYAGMNDAKVRLNEKIAKRVEAADPKRAAALRAEIASLSEPGGALYKVDIPDEHIAKMLDWDKPLSEQAPEVQVGLKNSGLLKYTDDYFKVNKKTAPTGADLHDFLKYSGYDQWELSSKMADQGIPGIRYLDGGSRGTGQGTSNFVVFPGNEGLLTILERNGQALR
jgi:hypothetical protein